MQIISKVDEPTEQCAGMVDSPKANGKVRICVDLTNLNENIPREFHPLPSVDHTQLAQATVFSKLDANSGFWQIGLSLESEHDKHLEATLHKLKEADLTLNEEKCEFSKPSVEYLGSVIDSEGVRVHPKKVEAILEMETPKDQSSLRTFQGAWLTS